MKKLLITGGSGFLGSRVAACYAEKYHVFVPSHQQMDITCWDNVRSVMEEFRPDVVIGTGGYVCFPVLKAAQTMGIPTVLHESNAHEPLAPASVTKVMTMLLIMEAIDSGSLHWSDSVTGTAHAASMGGSQIWLKEGEQVRYYDAVTVGIDFTARDMHRKCADTSHPSR